MHSDNRLQEAKERVRIHDLWALYGFEGEPRTSCRSPFREDRHPSFSVTADGLRWKDFATDAGGDVIDFIAEAEGIDNRQACLRLLDIAGLGKEATGYDRLRAKPQVPNKPKKGQKRPKPIPGLEQLRRGTRDEKAALLALRRFPAQCRGALDDLEDRGFLRFCDHEDGLVWVVLDETFRNLQMRRIDGMHLPVGDDRSVKAKTWPGSQARFPLGVKQIQPGSHILLVEGGPDLLAASVLVHQRIPKRSRRRFSYLAFLGAGQTGEGIDLPDCSGVQATLFQHTDQAGKGAVARWSALLADHGCSDLVTFRFRGMTQPQGPNIKDLADMVAHSDRVSDAHWSRLDRILQRPFLGTLA
ncbi:MAG: CHC2 zinc finger domain-containing protein [Opitutales bacterium]